MKITGKCHCKEISVKAEIDLSTIYACHCTDCQIFAGGPFRVIVNVDKENILTTGNPKEYIKTGDSGNKRIQAFCGKCSTSLYSTSLKRDKFSLRTGFLDQRESLIPKKHIYGRSSAKWLKDIYDNYWVTTMTDSEPFEFE
tara:strand:- start:48 stop:470 length:423 start_codon:yes stop_codon:yes gene_type:complete